MIQVFEPEFTEQDIQEVAKTLRSGYINESSLTKLFEQRFAERVGSKHAVATTSGTMALFMALKAAGVTPMSRVAVPDFTAIGTIRAVQLTGALTLLVDVDEQGNLDVDAAVESDASHVIAVHNNGYPCRLEELIEHFGESFVIEDACQGIGSYYCLEKHLGTIAGFGCFSLATTKIVTSGQGGVIVTDDDEANVALQRLKNQGNYRGVDLPDEYPGEGYNLKWTEMNAALALMQMSKLSERRQRTLEIAEMYHENGVCPLPQLGILPWRITAKVPAKKRSGIIEEMKKRSIVVQPFPKPIHQHFDLESFPKADKYASEGLYLPSSFTLKDDEVQCVCDSFSEVMKSP